MSDKLTLIRILEAVILASPKPLNVDKLLLLFSGDEQPERKEIQAALLELEQEYAHKSLNLKQVAGGYRFQVASDYAPWVARLWQEKPAKYSRAMLETLALIAYRQPVTRAEIEEIRGVAVSSHIVKTLLERNWVRIIGHRDVPGKPALLATTTEFLNYFGLSSLNDLPPLAELRDLGSINRELDLGDIDISIDQQRNDLTVESDEDQPAVH